MYKLIKVPSSFGAPLPGTHKGPDRIVRAMQKQFGGNLPLIESIEEVNVSSCTPARKKSKAKNLEEVRQVCSELTLKVALALKSGKKPLVFHGDDSSVIGVGYGIYGALEEPFGLVYFDAHGDINTPGTTPSGQLYGMGVAHLLGLGYKELLRLNDFKPAVKPENIVLIGQRNLEYGEVELIRRKKISVYPPSKLEGGVENVLLEIKEKFGSNGIRKLYLHFDQDVVDPTESGATLCIEREGLSLADFYRIVESLKNDFEIICVSFGNYLPGMDLQGKTLTVILGLLKILGVTNGAEDLSTGGEPVLTEKQKKQVEKQLKRHQEVRKKYAADIRVKDFVLKRFSVHPNVFRADVMTSSRYLAEFLVENKSLYEGKMALDMGCGAGIQGIVMGLNGAKKIVSSDISEEAVVNARENMERFGLKDKARVMQGDLFEKVKQKFDVIVFNHPFFPAKPLKNVPVSRSMLDEGELIRRFLREAKNYLAKDGVVIMPFFQLAGTTNDPKMLAGEYGYSIDFEKNTPNVRIGLQKGGFGVYVLKEKIEFRYNFRVQS